MSRPLAKIIALFLMLSLFHEQVLAAPQDIEAKTRIPKWIEDLLSGTTVCGSETPELTRFLKVLALKAPENGDAEAYEQLTNSLLEFAKVEAFPRAGSCHDDFGVVDAKLFLQGVRPHPKAFEMAKDLVKVLSSNEKEPWTVASWNYEIANLIGFHEPGAQVFIDQALLSYNTVFEEYIGAEKHDAFQKILKHKGIKIKPEILLAESYIESSMDTRFEFSINYAPFSQESRQDLKLLIEFAIQERHSFAGNDESGKKLRKESIKQRLESPTFRTWIGPELKADLDRILLESGNPTSLKDQFLSKLLKKFSIKERHD